MYSRGRANPTTKENQVHHQESTMNLSSATLCASYDRSQDVASVGLTYPIRQRGRSHCAARKGAM